MFTFSIRVPTGYTSVSRTGLSVIQNGPVEDSVPIWLSELQCTGDESDISQCPSRGWGSHDCDHTQDVEVECSNDPISTVSLKIKLVGNQSSQGEGRLSVRYNGVWGRVCASQWDIRDAHVACRQLGFTGARSLVKSSGGEGPKWMDNLHCLGNETALWDCPFGGWGHSHSECEDAGVVCQKDSNYQVRLVGGSSPREGRVEVFHSGVWGTVCKTHWGSEESNTVCRQLGYGHALATEVSYSPGTGLVLLDGVKCSGEERMLVECKSLGWGVVNHHCVDHSMDVGVACDGEYKRSNLV